MKKQAQRSSRQTPPFAQYMGQNEQEKFPLSQNYEEKLIGFKDMQQINLQKKQLNVGEILDKRKQKRTRNNEGKKQRLKKVIKGSEKNNTDKNIFQPNNKYGEQLEENSDLGSQFTQKKSNEKEKKKIKSKEKCIDKNKDKIHKKKNKSKEKACVFQQKKSQDKSRGKINPLHNFSECIYPPSQDLRQVYNIHANRQKNNRSYNAEYRTKIQHHRKLLSQCFPKAQKSKRTLKKQPSKKIEEQEIKNMSESKNLTRLKDIRIVHEVLKSSSLDSLDYYRLQTNYAAFEGEIEDKVLGLKENNKGGTNKRILEQLYNQSDSYGQALDSEDQKLLTMISQDTQIMRMNIGEKITKIRSQGMSGGKEIKQLNEQHQIKVNFVEKFKQEQLPASKNNKQQLIKTIDSILNQISNFSDKKIQEPKIEEELKQKIEENSDHSRSSSFSSTFSAGELALFRSDKWNSLPSVLELQVILDNCLAQGLSLDQSRVKPKLKKQDEYVSKNRNTLYEKNEKKQLEREQKWKFNQAKGIEKAKKLLKIGLYQATKLLNISNPSQISNKKRGEIKGNNEQKSNYSQKRLRIKCKSMMSLKYLQNYPDHEKLKRQEQSSNRQKMKPNILNQQVIVEKMKQSNRIDLFPLENSNNDDYSKQKLAALTTKQVQEIIEFICLDLYIGFIQQIQIQFENPINLFESLYQGLSKLRTSKKLGFSTAPKDIYNLLQKLSTFLEQTNDIDKDEQKSLKEIIFERIKNSIGPKPNQLLKFMREVQYQPEEQGLALQQKESFALSSTWFHQFSQKYVSQFDFGIYYFMDQDRELKRKSFLKNAMHVHNKAIFDSINQIIDNYRPFGIIGQPFPWKKFLKPPQPNFNIILNKTFEKVIQNSKYLCGIFSEQHMGRSLTSEQYLEFSEDRLNKILCQDVKNRIFRYKIIKFGGTLSTMSRPKFLFKNLIIQAVKQILKLPNPKVQLST